MKILTALILTALILTLLPACTQQAEPISAQKPQTNVQVEMPQDCREYFDGLKELAKDNQNLAEKFGDKLAEIDETWQALGEQDKQKFREQCTISNRQLQEKKGTPELDKLLNEL